MATITCADGRLRVRFTRAEHLLGLVCDLDVPASSVVSAEALSSWRGTVAGFRWGTSIPGFYLLGTWYARHRRQLVALRRGQRLVRVRLLGERFDEVLVSSADPEALVAAVQAVVRVSAEERSR